MVSKDRKNLCTPSFLLPACLTATKSVVEIGKIEKSEKMRLYIIFLFLVIISGGSSCPSRCLCDENTARCWLPMETVPNREIIHVFGRLSDGNGLDLSAYTLTWIFHEDKCPPSLVNCV